ncbi:MAG: hypothetical protein ACQCXQ_10365 [Verrucomicrobiales bacterium]|nr:hypothetical protein [Verrucomicrobiota bacterium JB025]
MKKYIAPLLAAASALFLSGCLQNETTLHINKDGSGKLVEETRLGAQMLTMMGGMAAMGGEQAATDPLDDMFTEEKARERAAKMGEGVEFSKIEKIDKNGAKGARVIYTIKDINQFKLSSDAGMENLSSMGGPNAQQQIEEAKEEDKPITFSLKNDTLTVNLPQPKPEDAEAAGDDANAEMENPQMEAMMKEMLGDMKMSIKIVVESGISKTTATHSEGNTVTLMEMDMAKIMENPDGLKKLTKMDQQDPNKAMEELKDVKGVKFEPKETITIKLK